MSDISPVLVCEGLTKTYRDTDSEITVFSQLNFSLRRSEIVAIVGSSGSGKSTLLHLLGGLDHPTAGTVTINNCNPYLLNESKRAAWRNRELGFIYQFHHLLPEFSALENVAMPLLLRGVAPAEAEGEAENLLIKVGLAERILHRSGQLSGGERQRVAIARALVTKPSCILADEPTGNLDPTNAEKVLALFLELQSVFATSVIMVTHDATIAQRADRTLRIDKGQLLAN